MRLHTFPDRVKVWASARDTSEWANRPYESWPCSQLEGRRFFAEFDANGLVELVLDGGRGDQDVDGNELSACVADLLRPRLGPQHPLHFITIGQFEAAR